MSGAQRVIRALVVAGLGAAGVAQEVDGSGSHWERARRFATGELAWGDIPRAQRAGAMAVLQWADGSGAGAIPFLLEAVRGGGVDAVAAVWAVARLRHRLSVDEYTDFCNAAERFEQLTWARLTPETNGSYQRARDLVLNLVRPRPLDALPTALDGYPELSREWLESVDDTAKTDPAAAKSALEKLGGAYGGSGHPPRVEGMTDSEVGALVWCVARDHWGDDRPEWLCAVAVPAHPDVEIVVRCAQRIDPDGPFRAALVAALDSDEPRVRVAAILRLGLVEDMGEDLRERIASLLEDPDPRVVRAAERVLR